jgi:hypothetical protein
LASVIRDQLTAGNYVVGTQSGLVQVVTQEKKLGRDVLPCWFILLLTTYYLFLGTPMEERFLEVDQVIADFQRSGMNDLRAFIIQDYLGGGFFHSLLGPASRIPAGRSGRHRGEGVEESPNRRPASVIKRNKAECGLKSKGNPSKVFFSPKFKLTLIARQK